MVDVLLTDEFVLSRKVEFRIEIEVSRPALSPLVQNV